MEKQIKKITFNKGGTGHVSGRVILPIKWVEDMGVNKEFSSVEMFYDSEKKEIIIKKSK